MSERSILEQQIDYYRARAGEYDEWWFRRGRYDRGADLNSRWHADTNAVGYGDGDVAGRGVGHGIYSL